MLLPYLKENCVEAGCDEAGRGCLAGAVYAAAVILPPDFKNELLNDSKQLTEKQRYALREVIEKTGAKVELGGGIRSMDDIDAVLALGVSRVIIGSAAVKNTELVKQAVDKYGEKIAVGIDALGGTVRTHGWLNDSGEDYITFAKKMESIGVKTIIFTDIDKDGMLEGPNFDQLLKLRNAVKCEIVASGGVTTLEDIAKLRDLKINAAIAGKAVYTGALDLVKAIQVGEDK